MDNFTAGREPGPDVALSSSTVYPEDTAAAFEMAAILGYDAIELMVGLDPASTDVDYVAGLQDRHQVAVCSVHAPCLLITQNVWSSDPWERLRRSCVAAQRLGADVVVVHPPFRWQRGYATNFIAGVARLMAESGITIAVENMYPWRTLGSSFQAYLPNWDPTDLPFDALTLDLSHAATARADSMRLTQTWGPRLQHAHLTDGSGSLKDEHLFPGQGNQDSWAVVEYLTSVGFAGHFVHEINTRKAASRADRARMLAGVLADTRRHIGLGRSAPIEQTSQAERASIG